MQARNVLLAVPGGGDGRLTFGVHRAIMRTAESPHHVNEGRAVSSALTMNFNELWIQALNRRTTDELIDRFVMIHTDVEPTEADWLDKLLALLDETGADVLSVVSAIKDPRGLSSTALDTNRWTPRRFTFRELYELPATFDGALVKERFGANLLVNTGLMAVRFEGAWVEQVCFGVDNCIVKMPDGTFRTFFESEDWRFSRWANAHNLKLAVTRTIPMMHRGDQTYSNAGPWGTQGTDKGNLESSALAQTGQMPG